MTEEIINKDELKNLRFLLQNGQKLAISTKEFERVFDKIDSLEQENNSLQAQLNNITVQSNNVITALEQENKHYKQLLQGCPADGDDCGFREIDKRNKELEQENRELQAYRDINEDFKKAWDELNEKYTEVLKLAKENADSNEYCLQELEQENKALKDNNNHLQAIIDDGRAENKRFREENKELKEMLSEKPKAMQAFQIAYGGLKKENEVLWGMVKDYKSALEEIREKAQYCIKQDVCALCDYSEECAIPDADDLVYDNNRLLIKLINEVLNDSES